ncbi:hypothetical protein MUK42_32579 [Musa troglodytarum]|uniref:Uncharacterized protein n=1 Tax=Musa troglodytarum TaxID=320322 RepID=A0A9E7JU04_9LILI|nr:hypothetical protein MUK42_32579 [Musa troglodytarum]
MSLPSNPVKYSSLSLSSGLVVEPVAAAVPRWRWPLS